jgi:hypothetical protein
MSGIRTFAEHLDRATPLRLTLVLLLLRPPGDFTLRGLTWLLAGLALAVPRLTVAPLVWAAIAAAVVARLVEAWPLADNHIYLLAYWCLAIALSLATADPYPTLARAGRWLVGATFGCAVIWKALAAPDFLDARFFRVTLVTDERFACAAQAIGGLTPDQLADNRDALAPLPEGVDVLDGPVLVEPPALRALAAVLTWGGLAIESLVAIAFLAPISTRLPRLGHPLLLAFIAGIYALAPVAGFGWLLAAIGLAQVDPRAYGLRLAYVAVFALVLVYAETPLVPWLLGCAAP